MNRVAETLFVFPLGYGMKLYQMKLTKGESLYQVILHLHTMMIDKLSQPPAQGVF